MREAEFHDELIRTLKEIRDIMATLDVDVQTATTLLNELVAALGSAGSGVSAADQTALETAITAAQAALPSTATPPVTTTPVPTVPEAPAAPAEPVVTDPAVA